MTREESRKKTGRGRGILVISGPSGAGKSSICERLLAAGGYAHSVSATTRRPRPGETEGVDYYFLGREEFERRAAAGGFIEHAEFGGHLYGTPLAEMERGEKLVAAGSVFVLDVEVQGAARLMELYPGALFVFVMPPDRAELARRLRDRASDSEEAIARRLEIAEREMSCRDRFDRVVTNRSLAETVSEVKETVARALAPGG